MLIDTAWYEHCVDKHDAPSVYCTIGLCKAVNLMNDKFFKADDDDE